MSLALAKAAESARNLMPGAFSLAVDPQADIKQRWSAFDQLYAFVLEELQRKGEPLKPPEFEPKPERTEEQLAAMNERALRFRVASMVLMLAYGATPETQAAVMWQAEELVPASPDPDTWRPPMTPKDMVILFESTKVLQEEFPEDWAYFFKAESEPVERRRLAFRRMYACTGAVWRECSPLARSLQPIHRQRLMVLALMCWVPQEQWTTEDLENLQNELLPVEEPDWEELKSMLG